ncbi:pyridoxamine 5'-phosphate oxidase family protein [Streptomyces sp. DSM 42041]|uniref:Pyridoxamine 5'-phosphate oxidase family protein n=1 Tax=Streptomyces hazeniae TaxID=3075538 RepID=A0ABU2NL50_9ACTN|nr:pyridoxamine 5'-phosphate oxidase family protein [Streptomyces sp. DSM 42041]MDT0377485.1 pyridoxamine 5'-phosphate oxidase family protein [Streptomyces sp. DSM 42041]
MTLVPAPEIDVRFGAPEAVATPWAEVARTLREAELYWLTTVRRDGRPHVTPLIGVTGGAGQEVHFCTGLREQKARNLGHGRRVALTTGANAWNRGLDVVVEGVAVPVTGRAALREIAEAYETKYGDDWHFDVGDGVFGSGDDAAAVFRVEPVKVLAFAKDPHGQTRYRFPASA